jgi:hypothetical protein
MADGRTRCRRLGVVGAKNAMQIGKLQFAELSVVGHISLVLVLQVVEPALA